MKLSILTCHLIDRRQSLARLMRRLVPQCCEHGHALDWDQMLTILLHENGLTFENVGVEWLIDPTPKGVSDGSVEGGVRKVTTGEKRNHLLARARGAWVTHVDDDDLVNPRYIDLILKALKSDPDVVGFSGTLLQPNKSPCTFIHSLSVKEWSQNNGIFYRTPNHLNVIRTSMARRVGFPNITHGEDRDFSDRIKSILKSEVVLEEPGIYEYHCR